MSAAAAAQTLKSVSRAAFSWKLTGQEQQTLAAAVSRSGVGLHSGGRATATLLPARAGEGRYFVVEGEETRVAAEVGNSEAQSPLCTTLRRGGARVRTVEHLLSAMEALGVDNCRVEVTGGDEIPLLDGSSQEWVEAIRGAGLCPAEDTSGQKLEKLAPKIHEPVYLRRDDCFVAAFPSSQIHITYGIDFPKAQAIGCQWFTTFLDANIYSSKIAPARTFCIFEEVEKMRAAGLIKGGSLENAMVCSMAGGWLNPPLRFEDEPCRHKILDLIGDFSLLGQNGNQGFPIAHVVAYMLTGKAKACYQHITQNINPGGGGAEEALYGGHGREPREADGEVSGRRVLGFRPDRFGICRCGVELRCDEEGRLGEDG